MCFSLMLETSQLKHLAEMTQILILEFNSFLMILLCSRWYLLRAGQKQEMLIYLYMSGNSSSTKSDLMSLLTITQPLYSSKVVNTFILANKWWLNVVCRKQIHHKYKSYLKFKKNSRKKIEDSGSQSIFSTSRLLKGLTIFLDSSICVLPKSINWWDQVK